MNNYKSLLEEPDSYIQYYRKNSNKYLIYVLLFMVISQFIISFVFFFYYMPKEINNFKSSLNNMGSEMAVLSKYEKKIDLMKNESTQIYDIIMNLCKNPAISGYCESKH
jgi:hypothetical protein